MTTENQQQKHQPTTLGYGDVVIYSQNGKTCNAQVLQSQIVPVPDRSAPGGQRNEEHLTLIYLIPAAGRQVMSQIEMDNAIGKAFGVQELTEDNKTGWLRATVHVDGGANTAQGQRERPEFAAEQQEHAGQHTG
jgi:hypothetical protein